MTGGDIQANILINSQCRACLADFGFTVIAETSSVGVEGYSDHEGGGTIRWMAPEILDPKRYGYVERARRKLPSKKTDIYALGMTILEVCTTLLILSPSVNFSPVGHHRPESFREHQQR